MQYFDKSVNTDKFCQYLTRLREKNKGRRIALFMDNLRVHTSMISRNKMKELDFEVIFNVPYFPDANAIEGCFAIAKGSVKRERLNCILTKKKTRLETLLKAGFKKVSKEKCENLVRRSKWFLNNA